MNPGRTTDSAATEPSGLAPTAGAALALVVFSLALVGQHLLLSAPGSGRVATAAYLFAAAAFIWLSDLRRYAGDEPLRQRLLGAPWREPAAGWPASASASRSTVTSVVACWGW